MKLTTWLGLLITAVFLAFTVGAHAAPPGGIEPRQMDSVGRWMPYTIPQIRTLNGAAGACTVLTGTTTYATTMATTGSARAGLVLVASIDGFAHITRTTTIAPPPYPGKLHLGFFDNASNGTIQCSSVEIRGYDWRGSRNSETITNLTESGAFTTKSWRIVDYVAATGCAGGATSDQFHVRASGQIALPRRIGSSANVTAICAYILDEGIADTNMGCVAGSLFTYDLTQEANSVNLVDADWQMPAGAGCLYDGATVRVDVNTSITARTY
ncbi:hypothetical protein [Bacteriophage sp.]|nr:hypothetical protein [Bacteriophage sp.]UOF80120.1 hypothetical protein [Bacteriophage sp.]